MKHPRVIIAFCAIVAILAMAWVWLQFERREPVAAPSASNPVTTARVGGAFTLVDHRGNPVSDRDFRGRVLLMTFGYTSCPSVCPTTLQRMAEAMELLGERAGKAQPLFVTVDPQRDTPEVLAAYVGAFHPSLVGLTGSAGQIDKISEDYRVYRAKVGSGNDDYLMDHSAYIYLIDAEGRLATYLRHDATPQTMAAAVASLLATGRQTARGP